MLIRSRIGLVWAGCLAILMLMGCAQHKAYEAKTAPPVPKADGLVASGKFRAVVVEDVDNDGNLDIVGGASSPGMVTISYGDGRGAVSEPQILPVHGEVHAVAIADFNEDGLNDIVFSVQKETAGIRLWLNQSNRLWKQQNGPVKIGNYPNITSADVNGDGHMDVIAANSTEDKHAGIQVWLGDGKGGWIVESGPTTLGRYMDVAVADLDKDGIPDLVGAGWGQHGSLRVWLGDGSGRWSSTPLLNTANYYGVNIGDLNNDGNADILAATHLSGIHTFLGDGNGKFAKSFGPIQFLKRRLKVASINGEAAYPLSGSPSFWKVLPVDLNGDGLVDIVAGSLDDKGVLAWRNLGDDNWAVYEGKFPQTGIYYEINAADLNTDGYRDICAVNYGEGIQIWPGNTGRAIKSRRMEIEPLPATDQMAILSAPEENEVFTTISGLAEYKIGPGDMLEINFWEGMASTSEEVVVRPDGKISFRYVDDILVNGLTASQLDRKLTQSLKSYIRKPKIDVVIKEYKSKSVTLLGAIAYRQTAGTGPGKYRLKGKTTLLEVVTKAGGPTEKANLTAVNIRRKSGDSISLDLFKAIHQGEPGTDFILDDGDLVFIPTFSKEDNRVYVFGEVEKPGVVNFKNSKMRLIDAISEAGGPTVFAATPEARVVRGDITKPEVISANLQRLIEEGDQSQNITLASGDMIYVPRTGLGSVNVFAKRIRPLLELILWPARLVNDWDRAIDVTGP